MSLVVKFSFACKANAMIPAAIRIDAEVPPNFGFKKLYLTSM